ncbi:filamentous hemagglutinin N-terminal domain-containing protein [Calothrix sp. CCY 0018]|uniref:two-partner secretion domain-containing protein n=1 Tax=Calothrix sp. CCY 0018 TaxID=3103864 RepID=UPI0039C72369
MKCNESNNVLMRVVEYGCNIKQSLSQINIRCGWFLGIACTGIGAFGINPANAQITPDNTLPNNSSVTKDGNINIIQGGTTADNNLFHSFKEFGVINGDEAYFNNRVDISNIITRVTGGSESNINGLIRANGEANLFLINPAGIVFGENALLNIGGSFVGSTADSIKFGDDIEFSAINPQNTALLTVSVPLGLQYGKNQTNTISNSGNLSVNSGKNITLIGNSFENTGELKTNGGQISIAAISNEGFANLGKSGELLSLENQQLDIIDGNASNIGTVINRGRIDAASLQAGVGGKVIVLGERLGLLENSLLDVSGSVGGGEVTVGNIDTSAVYIDPKASINSNALTTGDGGKITVSATESTRAYGSFSARGGLNNGNGGTVATSGTNFLDIADITVDTNANNGLNGNWLLNSGNIIFGSSSSFNGTSTNNNFAIFQPAQSDTVLDISTIEKQLSAGNNITIAASKTDTQAGNIKTDQFVDIKAANNTPVTLTLQADNDINLPEFGIDTNNRLGMILQADMNENGKGNISLGTGEEGRFLVDTKGGKFTASANDILFSDVTINSSNAGKTDSEPIRISTAGSFEMNASGIIRETSGDGNGGEININADSFSLQGGIENNTIGNGNAGDINIEVNSFSLKGGLISSETEGAGNNGLVTIKADNLELERGLIQSLTTSDGDARDIIIEANSVSLKGGSLSTINESNGKAGNISIDADKIFIEQASVLVDNGGITEENGGDINIKADSLSLQGGAIDNITNGNVNAGKINIEVNSLSVKNGLINSETQGDGKSGLVTIKTDTLDIDRGGIRSITKGDNNKKDIDDVRGIKIDATNSVTLKNGDFSTRTEGNDNAGNIDINATNEILLLEKAAFTTDSNGQGNAGKIILDTGSLILDNQGIIASNANAKENDFSSVANAGEIEINVDSILLQNDSAITSQTFVAGIGGEIKIQADKMTLKNNSNITSSAEGNESTGNAGKIIVDVDSILIETEPGFVSDNPNIKFNPNNDNASGLTSITRGKGNAGEIEVTASEIFLANKGKISTTTEDEGNAGKITLNTSLLQLENSATEDGAGIRSGSSGSGAAGEITVTADKVLLNNSEIEALSNSGDGGNINLNVDRLLELRRGSQITTNAGTAQQGGNGGNINIDSKFIVAIPKENSDITANAFSDSGGRVEINSLGVFGIEPRIQQTDESDITASSEQGVQGVTNINAPDNNSIQNSLIELAQNTIDSEALIATSCVVRSKERNGTFYIIGSQGFPYSPGDAVPSKYSALEVQSVPNKTSALPRRRWKMGDPIVEPTGVYRLANGRRILSRECGK